MTREMPLERVILAKHDERNAPRESDLSSITFDNGAEQVKTGTIKALTRKQKKSKKENDKIIIR